MPAEDLVFEALKKFYVLYREERALVQFIEQQIETLRTKWSHTEALLKDAEERQFQETSSGIRNWLHELKDVFYVLDDILDECSTEANRDRYGVDRSCTFLGFLHPQKVMFQHSMTERMKALVEKMEMTDNMRKELDLIPTTRERQGTQNRRPTSSFITEDWFEGRDDDKNKIVEYLLGDVCKEEELSIYPIVAIGGMGKTTLAQHVYQDDRIQKYYSLTMWVYVSTNFDMEILIKDIIESAGGRVFSQQAHVQWDVLLKELHNILHDQRYLLVMDDVWNDQEEEWKKLRGYMKCGLGGSSILVTTREIRIGDVVRTPHMEPYLLGELSGEVCWQLFRWLTFESGVSETEDLIRIGKKIVEKCKGVPLAVKTLGGLLSSTSDKKKWRHIQKSSLWSLSGNGDSIFPALRLSYLHLPLNIRSCFAYCAVFPKGYEIQKQHLIHLWMANGLISGDETLAEVDDDSGDDDNVSEDTREVEDIADEMFQELYSRSLIVVTKRDDSGNILCFKIHDLIHDVVQFVMGDESCVLNESSSATMSRRTRHITVHYKSKSSSPSQLLQKFDSLRTLIFLRKVCSGPIYLLHTGLRALDLSRVATLDQLSSSLSDLKHLRYLNLSRAKIKALPDSICSLCNLEILVLNGCKDLQKLPGDIGYLINLRHLYLNDCWSLTCMPSSLSRLILLRTLTLVVVGDDGKMLGFQLSKLGSFKKLKGGLTVKHLERVTKVEDAEEAKLNEKQYLNQLTLSWEWGLNHEYDGRQHQVQILEALVPAASELTRLQLMGYEGNNFSNWMMNEIASFEKLEFIDFCSCKNVTRLPPLWRMKCLKGFRLEKMYSLRYLIRSEDYNNDGSLAFEQLERLMLHCLPKLERIMEDEEAEEEMNIDHMFPSLTQLIIDRCPRFSSFSRSVSADTVDWDDEEPSHPSHIP